jgi:hypothetical protein
MNPRDKGLLRVLAIDPTTRGFGFVVFEGPEMLVDWGVFQVRSDKHAECLRRVEALLDRYEPFVVVVEDHKGLSCRRCVRVRALINAVCELASRRTLTPRRVSPRSVRRAFSEVGVSTKYEIAGAVSSRFPELAPRLPPPRKTWMGEREAMSVLDAALALTFLESIDTIPRDV